MSKKLLTRKIMNLVIREYSKEFRLYEKTKKLRPNAMSILHERLSGYEYMLFMDLIYSNEFIVKFNNVRDISTLVSFLEKVFKSKNNDIKILENKHIMMLELNIEDGGEHKKYYLARYKTFCKLKAKYKKGIKKHDVVY